MKSETKEIISISLSITMVITLGIICLPLWLLGKIYNLLFPYYLLHHEKLKLYYLVNAHNAKRLG